MQTVCKKGIRWIALFALALALVIGAAAQTARAEETTQTLQVANWTGPTTLANVTGRPTVIYDNDTYHMWYGVADTELKYTSSDSPDGFPAGELVSFATEEGKIVPVERNSPTIVKEGETFYMVAYGEYNTEFYLYQSTDGKAWEEVGKVFDSSAISGIEKIDCPFLLKDDGSYNLYFQARSSVDPKPYYIYLATAVGPLSAIADGDDDLDFALANEENPVLSPTESAWDGSRVMQPWVVKDGDTYYMWYAGYTTGNPKTGFAYSSNGINWTKGRSQQLFPAYAGSAEPAVVKVDGTWHLWFYIMGDSASTQYISASGPFQFSSIQAAIDAAQPGDTINVAAGTYTGDILINKSLSLVTNDGATIQGVGTGYTGAVKVAADVDDVVIKGFDIIGAGQAAVYLSGGASNITIEGNTITAAAGKNALLTEGGVSNITVKSNTFNGDASQLAYVNGTTSVHTESSEVDFINNTFTDTNSLALGLEAVNSKVTGNTFNTTSSYAVLELFGTSATVSNNNFTAGDVLVVDQTKTLEVKSIIDGNEFAGAAGVGNSVYGTINAAVNAAAVNDTIHVAAGIYNEALVLNKNGLKLLGAGRDTTTIVGPKDAGQTILMRADGLLVDGFTITRAGNNPEEWSGNQNNSLVSFFNVTNSTLQNCTVTGGRNGIYFNQSYDNWTSGNTIKDNLITNNRTGVNVATAGENNRVLHNVISDNWTHGVTFTNPAGYSAKGFTFAENRIFDNWISQVTNKNSSDPLDPAINFESNWFGTAVPEFTTNTPFEPGYDVQIPKAFGGTAEPPPAPYPYDIADTDPDHSTIDFDPWCGDAECTFLVSTNEQKQIVVPNNATGDQIQTILDDAPAGSTIFFPADTYEVNGGFKLNKEGLKIILEDGAVIEPNSPCLLVNADHVRITSETIGGAVCKPTASSAGIEVADGVNDLIINGIEIDGTGQSPTAGILFRGDVTDVVIVNNYIHDVTLDGTTNNPAILFNTAPSGEFEVKGNLFKNTSGIAGDNISIDATYNSWGSYTVTPEMVYSGTGGSVLFDPWTHVDLYIESSGTPWDNQVAVEKTITYVVYANLQNVTGADFTLKYPTGILDIVSATPGAYFTSPDLGGSVLNTTTDGEIRFAGYSTSGAVSGDDLVLFTVEFKAVATGDGELAFDETTDAFAMAASGSSTFIYADALVDGSVKVIALPTLSSDDIDGPYTTGVQQEFQVALDNPGDGGDFNPVLFRFTIKDAQESDIDSLEYWEDYGGLNDWLRLGLTQQGDDLVGYYGPHTGFPLPSPYTATSKFRVTFHTARDYGYVYELTLVDLSTDTVLATITGTAKVDQQPILSSADIQGPYVTGVEQAFNLRLQNPDSDRTYAKVLVNLRVTGAAGQIASLKFQSDDTWHDWVLTEDNGDLIGSFGPAGGFALGPNYDVTTLFHVKFNEASAAKEYPFNLELVDQNSGLVLATFTDTAVVNEHPSFTFTKLAGPYLTGISQEFQVQLTNPTNGGTFASALARFVVSDAAADDIAAFQYQVDSGTWANMPLGPDSDGNLVGYFGPPAGFPVGTGYDETTTFRVTFNKAGTYPVTVSLVDLDRPDEFDVLTSLSADAVVYGQPQFSDTLDGKTFLTGDEYEYTVTLDNPADGGNFDVTSGDGLNNVIAKFTLFNASLADIADIQYYEVNDSTWKPLSLASDGEGNLIGHFGPAVGFPMPEGYNAVSRFKVTFQGDLNKDFSYEINLYEMDTDWLLTTHEGEFTVHANYDVTGTVSMQGRVTRAGVPMSLQGILVEDAYEATSIDQISNNLSFSQVVADTYTLTTNQPRYLNVSGKTVVISKDKTTINPLELKGGNAVDTDNVIDVNDASAIGTVYGTGDIASAGDVNFDGKVNIFDLAMVGGNYGVTASDAYAGWTP